MHQRWKAHQGKHAEYEGDDYSGEEMVREGDGLEMMGKIVSVVSESWRRRMGKIVSVV